MGQGFLNIQCNNFRVCRDVPNTGRDVQQLQASLLGLLLHALPQVPPLRLQVRHSFFHTFFVKIIQVRKDKLSIKQRYLEIKMQADRQKSSLTDEKRKIGRQANR